MRAGILALQGDVPEHRSAFEQVLGPGSVVLVRDAETLARVDLLALPGGESTTVSRLLDQLGLRTALAHRLAEGLPVLATCAGLILLGREVEAVPGGRNPDPLGVLDVRIRRNDYGRQRESFEAPVTIDGLGGGPFPGVFIRAPRILHWGPTVDPFAHRGAEVVGVRSGLLWGLTFHPELSGDPRLIDRFVSECRARR